jgi:hypothetical protein
MNTGDEALTFGTYIRNLGGFLLSNIFGLAVTLILSLAIQLPQVRGLISNVLPLDKQTAWHLTRGAATVAYLTVTASMAWGLVLSSKIAKDITPAPITLEMHQTLSWLGVGIGAFHGFLLLFDTYYHYVLTDLLIPFTGPYRPVPAGLGIIGLYLLWVTSASFSWRSWMGHSAWRLIHYLTFPAFALATAHGILSGTDSKEPSMQIMYLASILLILFLTSYRLMAGRKERRPAPARTA